MGGAALQPAVLDRRILQKLNRSLRDYKPPKPVETGYRLEPDKRGPKPMLSDEQVLECRAAFEFEGATRAELCERYGVTPAYLTKLLGYIVRSKLIPRQKAVNK